MRAPAMRRWALLGGRLQAPPPLECQIGFASTLTMSARGLWQVQLSQYLDSVRAQGLVEGYSFGTPTFLCALSTAHAQASHPERRGLRCPRRGVLARRVPQVVDAVARTVATNAHSAAWTGRDVSALERRPADLPHVRVQPRRVPARVRAQGHGRAAQLPEGTAAPRPSLRGPSPAYRPA